MNRIRELRKDKNITQKYLAQQLGVANLTISKWERGIHQIKSDKSGNVMQYFRSIFTIFIGNR